MDIHQPGRRRPGTATNLTDNVYSLELLFPFSQSLVDDDLKSGGGKGDLRSGGTWKMRRYITEYPRRHRLGGY